MWAKEHLYSLQIHISSVIENYHPPSRLRVGEAVTIHIHLLYLREHLTTVLADETVDEAASVHHERMRAMGGLQISNSDIRLMGK